MRKTLFLCPLLTAGLAHSAEPPRPHITGISHVAFYTSQSEAAKRFYGDLLGLPAGPWSGVYVVGTQAIEAETQNPPNPPTRIAHVAFATDDAEGMRRFLAAHHITVPDSVHFEKSGTRWFAMKDPEGHDIEFVQEKPLVPKDASREISHRIIHAGFVVRDRDAEDKFYRDLLGFKLYWHGGMTDDRTEWADMQVPDGTQWLEYMIPQPGANWDTRILGIVNHVALGVPDIHAAAKALESRGWKSTEQEHPQIGRDGKWQLNLYDPDGTRVELMEFTPVQKPCCNAYTGQHPH
jgi:catechol 2,3-dioxygenase-like lactoylglutathione lyase family enzyme